MHARVDYMLLFSILQSSDRNRGHSLVSYLGNS